MVNERVLDEAMGEVIDLDYGDTITCITPSGGGMGDPLERDPEKVLADVIHGLITPDSALIDYGVVIDLGASRVDLEKTEEIRIRERSIRSSS